MRATGSVIRFDGFLKIYEEGHRRRGRRGRRPSRACHKAISSTAAQIEAKQHFTEPPPRYSEATLIKKMEELGIGRPSTYASTLNVLRDREYVRLDKKRLYPEDKGRLVTAFLESFFSRYVEYDFTADLEEKLDLISAGELDWKDVLRDFWREFIAAVARYRRSAHHPGARRAERDARAAYLPAARKPAAIPRLPVLRTGRLSLKIGKFGAFIGCSNYPDCRFTRQLADGGDKTGALGSEGKLLGADPETGLDVTLRTGRFGPYVQLGENGEEKPKRASIPKGSDPEGIDLTQRALACCRCRARSALHPETGKPITAGFGRFGPYVQHDGKYASLSGAEEVFTVGINRAVSLLAEKAASAASPRRHGDQGARRASRARRRGAGLERPLRPLRQAWQGQRHAAQGPRSRGGDAGRGRRASLPREPPRDPAKKPARKASQAEARPRKRKRPSRRRQAESRPTARAKKRARGQGQERSQDPETVGKLPSKQEILDFLQGASGEAGKREIARAFGIKGGDRIALKELLARHGRRRADRRLAPQAPAPRRAALGHRARDRRARLLWRVHRPAGHLGRGARAAAPHPHASRASSDVGPAAGIGDRVLARITPLGADADYPYQARPIKRSPRATRSQLGIFRALPGGGGVIDPVDRKQLKEWRVRARRHQRRRERRAGPLRARRAGALRRRQRPRHRPARQSARSAGDEPHRHPRPRHSRHLPGRRAEPRRRRRRSPT